MKAIKYNKSRIMKAAHREYNETKGLGGIYTFARALRVAWIMEKKFIKDCERAAKEKAEREEEERILAENKIEWEEYDPESEERLLVAAMELSSSMNRYGSFDNYVNESKRNGAFVSMNSYVREIYNN